MAMYYPQDTPIEIGPTGVVPGSQYLENRDELFGAPRVWEEEPDLGVRDSPRHLPAGSDTEGLPACGTAGTVTFIHFDLWHRAFPNQTDKVRYMMKFQFTRMSEPDKPYWNRRREEIDLGDLADDPRSAMWRNMWHWLSGGGPAAPREERADQIEMLARKLTHELEEIRLHAGYTIAEYGEPALPHLLKALEHDNNDVQRDACYGLCALGSFAVEPLVSLLGHPNERFRGYAAYALGDIRPDSKSVGESLVSCLDDPSPFVRQNAADALGQIKRNADSAVPALIRSMNDEDGEVRYKTAYALARFGEDAQAAIPVLADAIYDDNRYAQGHAAVALEQIGTPEALSALLHWLQASRWCPVTTSKSTF